MVAQPFKLEQTSDTGAKPTGGDALNSYRMSSPTPDATAGNTKPNVVEGNQLLISPISSVTATTDASSTATQPAATTKTAFADTSASITNPPADSTTAAATTPADTTAAAATTAAQTNPMLAAITDQGALPNPGQAVPLWMRLADPTLQPLIQQTYGVSSLNGFQSGAPVSDTSDGTDEIAMPMGHAAPHTSAAPSTSTA